MANTSISRVSRYRNSYREKGFITENDRIVYPHDTDIRVVVSNEEAGRLDRVAYRVYKNPLLSWVLANRNGILNPLTLEPGRVLYCPSVQRIYSQGGVMGI